jgi:hypothetical protein
MTSADLVRASRDGDQFHYYWAARQCLKLLRSGSGLAGVSIEGSSPLEAATAGEHVVDLAEYYGAVDPGSADKIIYRQLKHSTNHPDQPWTVSGLKGTLGGFSRKFLELNAASPSLLDHSVFDFVSNRPVDEAVVQAFRDIAQGVAPGHSQIAGYIRGYLGLSGDLAERFCQRFTIDARAPALLRLTHLFTHDVAALLPGAPNDGPLRLKEAVARRATSLEPDSFITKEVVLAALGASPDQLLPAPSLLTVPDQIVPVPESGTIAAALAASNAPLVVHAAGGVGKSVLASQLGALLPAGSVCLVYDCFARGGYRRSSSPRHEHRQGYVQLANQLAGAGLCDPLVPASPTPPASDYSGAFMARIRTAAESLAASSPGALLVLAIDAADNAVIAADEQDTGRSFVADLLREELPVNARVVEFCRTERIRLLDPPPGAAQVELCGFGPEQSRQHLESRLGPVQPADAGEFHRRTDGNARVQDQVMRETRTLPECLTRLGQVSGNDVITVDDLLTRLVDEAMYHDPGNAAAVRVMCQALAVLRPRIPVTVLVPLCGVSPSLVRSFAADLYGSLLADGDTLQFRDEPTETWFRSQFMPHGEELKAIVERLRPLAGSSAYAAASLPYLLWESGEFGQLVSLAMTDDALPVGNDLERHQIAQQRVQFALKAALRQRAYLPAARLALRAGAEGAGHSRLLRLLRKNPDLAGAFLDAQTTEDLVAARDLIGSWPNSNLVYEGALLSCAPSQQDYARSRLRSAIDWTAAWVSAPRQEHESHGVDADDIAEIAFGLLNVDGAAGCTEFLQCWRPPRAALKPAAIIASRLAQHGRLADISALLSQADAGEYLLAGVASAAARAGLAPGPPVMERCVAMLRARTEALAAPPLFSAERDDPDVTLAVCWIVALGVRYRQLDASEAGRILALYLPAALPESAGSRWQTGSSTVIKGLALLSRLRGEPFDVTAFAPAAVTEAGPAAHLYSSAAAEFKANVEPFAPWADLWAITMLDETADIGAEFQRATETLRPVPDYRTPYMFINAAARTGAFLLASAPSGAYREQFAAWIRSSHQYLSRDALTDIVQHAAGSEELHDLALDVAELIAAKIAESHDSAETQIEDLVRLSRAIYRLSPDESRAYFEQAVQAAERVGDDVSARWSALLTISGAAGQPGQPDRARAYRLAQITEALAPYLDDALDHEAALHAITQLDPHEGIAIASRWRDRRFGWLDPAVEALALRDDCALAALPLACIAMTMFQRNPAPLPAAERAVRRCPDQAQLIADAVAALPRYMVHAQSALGRLRAAAEESDVTLDGSSLDRYETPRHPGYEEDAGSASGRSWSDDRAAARDEAVRQLRDLDLASPAGLTAAQGLCRSTRLLWRDVAEAAVGYPPAKLAQVIRVMTADAGLSEFAYADVIRCLADRTMLPQSARAALREMARTIAARFCVSLTTKSYDPIDLAALTTAAGLSSDPMDLALEELGRRPGTLAGEACFALAGRLGGKLSPQDAAQVLDDACSQYQDIAPADAADGAPDDLAPAPQSAESCLAGFIWAALGDAAIATRWKAAHAVCVLIALRQSAVLEPLARYAAGELPAGPFTDRRLHFYDKHAVVWLLTALERSAAAADRSGLKPFISFLLATAEADKDHILVRQSAHNTLLTLHSCGLAELSPAAREALQRAGKAIAVLPGEPSRDASIPAAAGPGLRFFFDFKDHWCSPLGRAFGLTDEDVLQLAGDVVTGEWAMPYCSDLAQDERRNRELYADNSTWAHAADWPKEDDLDFYLGFHALMTVAGKLIRTRPVYTCDQDQGDQFSSWLRAFRPSCPDGRWLADRRDASPNPVLAISPPPCAADWEMSLSSPCFDNCLSTEDGWLTVWEHSTEQTYDRSQDIKIQSALVDPVHSSALVSALQTASSYYDFRLPDSDDDDFTVDEAGYRLSGWITVPSAYTGLDTRDPFAANVSFPPSQPPGEVTRLLGLNANPDMREWRRGNLPVMRSASWDDRVESGQTTTGPHGERLEIRRDTLDEVLRLTGTHLILTVMIDRSTDRRRHAQDGDNDERFPYREKSYKVFLFDSGGTIAPVQLGRRSRQSYSRDTRPV